MLDHAYKTVYLDQYIFDNDAHIGNILFKILDHPLLGNIGGNKVIEPKVYNDLI